MIMEGLKFGFGFTVGSVVAAFAIAGVVICVGRFVSWLIGIFGN